MVMPTGPKDIKKAEAAAPSPKEIKAPGAPMDATKLIIINSVIIAVVCSLFMGINYYLQNNLLNQKLSQISAAGTENADAGSEEEGETIERGIVLDLGDFILNLSDSSARRYLKINVAIELSRKETDPDPNKASSGGHGGHGESADPMAKIEQEMSQYKPAIRDAIISTISTKNSDELATIAGKEQAKQEIKDAVNAILNGDREVIRVSFGNFIIQ